jgi:hypothetical protein
MATCASGAVKSSTRMKNKLGYSLKNSFNNHRFHTDEYVLENKLLLILHPSCHRNHGVFSSLISDIRIRISMHSVAIPTECGLYDD